VPAAPEREVVKVDHVQSPEVSLPRLSLGLVPCSSQGSSVGEGSSVKADGPGDDGLYLGRSHWLHEKGMENDRLGR